MVDTGIAAPTSAAEAELQRLKASGLLFMEAEREYLPLLERLYDLKQKQAEIEAETAELRPLYTAAYLAMQEAAIEANKAGASASDLANLPNDRLGYWVIHGLIYRKGRKPSLAGHLPLDPRSDEARPKRSSKK